MQQSRLDQHLVEKAERRLTGRKKGSFNLLQFLLALITKTLPPSLMLLIQNWHHGDMRSPPKDPQLSVTVLILQMRPHAAKRPLHMRSFPLMAIRVKPMSQCQIRKCLFILQ